MEYLSENDICVAKRVEYYFIKNIRIISPKHNIYSLELGRNGMFNGSKQYSSAEDVSVCRCKRWVPLWQIFFPARHIFRVVDVSPGPWQTLMSRSILSQKLTESLGQMSPLLSAENNTILTRRVVFPLSYFIINIFYWNYYLGTTEPVDTTVESYIL